MIKQSKDAEFSIFYPMISGLSKRTGLGYPSHAIRVTLSLSQGLSKGFRNKFGMTFFRAIRVMLNLFQHLSKVFASEPSP